MSQLKILIPCLVFGLVSTVASAQNPQASATAKPPEQKKTVQDYANIALTQAFEEMGLKGPEKAYFDAEVLGDPMAFVVSHHTTSEGTDIQVDRDRLKNFVRFSAALFSNPQVGGGNRLCLVVRSTNNCATCDSMRSLVQSTLTSRLERRGFQIRTTMQVPEGAAMSGEKAFDYYVSRMGEAQCDGVLYSELTQDAVAQAAPEEPTDTKLRAAALLLVKEPGGKKLRSRGYAQIVVPTSVADEQGRLTLATTLVGRQALDLYSSIAAQTSGLAARNGGEERYLKVEGLHSFMDYVRVKQSLLQASPDIGIEERFITQGNVQFAITGSLTMNDVARTIRSISWPVEGQELKVLGVGSNEIVVVLK